MDIQFEKVGYTYQPQTPFEQRALYDIDLKITAQSYTALIGHTGSGKSTLLQHLNALLKPTSGKVLIGERVIVPESKNKNLKEIRKHVGIVFQFPEAQLFEETVEKDIMFGPKNFGVSDTEAKEIAREMIQLVGLDESYLERSPFELSGGQMRRVAIAGVLAMKPEILVLDEPTAGLDPKGRKEMLELFHELHQKHQQTIVLVTHQMDDVAEYAEQVFVLEKGEIVKMGTPREVFQDVAWLESKQLGVPTATAFAFKLQQKGMQFTHIPLTLEELVAELTKQMEQGGIKA